MLSREEAVLLTRDFDRDSSRLVNFYLSRLFDWVDESVVGRRKELRHKPVDYWFDQCLTGSTDVDNRFASD